MFSQTLGAFAASGVVYANYRSAIIQYEGGADIRTVPGFSETATAGIFCTYPQPSVEVRNTCQLMLTYA